MFFDCLALGVGLFASVMAAWKPNAEYTYGYGRVETLSGFANGVFLILISVFIVFEAVQRMCVVVVLPRRLGCARARSAPRRAGADPHSLLPPPPASTRQR